MPAAGPGIGAGLVLAWLRCFGEFGATVILAYHPYSLPVFAFVQFGSSGLPATMLPVAVALAVALVFLLASGMHAPRRRGRKVDAATLAAWDPPAAGVERSPDPLDFALRKRLGDFSLDLAHRASSPRLALLGPSGAGKTLTLRLLAGLMPQAKAGTSTRARAHWTCSPASSARSATFPSSRRCCRGAPSGIR